MSDRGLTYITIGNDRRYQELYRNNANFKTGLDLLVRLIPVLVGVLADDSEKVAEIQKLMEKDLLNKPGLSLDISDRWYPRGE